MLSRILGMLRDMAFAYYFGAGAIMDAWVIGFKIPNLARRIFGEGAAASAVIPVYSAELEKNKDNAAVLARTFATVVFVLLCGIVLLAQAVILWYVIAVAELADTKLMLNLTAIMLPYMAMVCLVAVLGGVLNAHHHFAVPAFAPVILNVCILAGLWVAGGLLKIDPQKQAYITAVFVLAAGVLQLLSQFMVLRGYGVSLRPAWKVKTEPFRNVLTLMGPMILGMVATQINTLVNDIIAKALSGSPARGLTFEIFGQTLRYPVWEGAVSSLFYAQRLYQFPLGVLGISLATAIFPMMTRAQARQDNNLLLTTIGRGLKGSIFVAVPATVGLWLVGQPLIALLFERGRFSSSDTLLTNRILAFYAIGLTGFFLQQILTRAFYSRLDSRLPAQTAGFAVVVNIILNFAFIWPMGAAGLALSTSLCSYIQVCILLVVLLGRLGPGFLTGLGKNAAKTVAATAAMALVGWLILFFLKNLGRGRAAELIRLAAVLGGCSITFPAVSALLKNEMLGLLLKKAPPDGSQG